MAENVAIIPARAGSKGVPGKNKRVVGGKPLIAYSIDAALAATTLDRIVVTSDDEETCDLARAAGAEVVRRPEDIAGDTSPVIDAVRHALAESGIDRIGALVLLQPTSPMRTGADIDAAVALFERTEMPVCSVYRVDDAHPARMYRMDGTTLAPLMPDLASIRRQDLPPIYHRNGAIYVVGQRELDRGEIVTEPMTAYEMSFESSINIDSELDLAVLEHVLGA